VEAVWEFVRTVFTSLWGIANVAVVLWFGSVWIRRRGTLLAAGMLVLSVVIADLVAPNLLGAATERMVSSPATSAADSLEALGESLGSVGWAALFMGGLLGAAVLPSTRDQAWLAALNDRATRIAQRRGKKAGNRARMKALEESGINPVGQLVRIAVTLGALVALWVAMRDMAGSNPAFSVLGISNLASSAVRPAFEGSHLLLGLTAGVSAGIAGYVRRRSDTDAISSKVGASAALLAAGMWLGASLFVPAGVLLAVAGYYAIQIPAAPMFRPSPSSLPRVSVSAATRASPSETSAADALAQSLVRASRGRSPSRSGAGPARGSGPGRASTPTAADGSSAGLASGSVGVTGKATSEDQRAKLLDIMRGRRTRGDGVRANEAGSQGRCGAPTKSGKPCRNKVVEGSNRCFRH